MVIPLADGDSSDRLEKTFRNADEVVRVRKIAPVARARNIGAMNASSENLLFLDSDMDLLGLDVASLEQYGYDLGTAYYNSPVTDDAAICLLQNVFAQVGHPHSFAGGFMFARKKVFLDVGGFRDVPLSDIEFGQRAWLMGYRISTFPYSVRHGRRFHREALIGRYFSSTGKPWGVP